jgi:hypothetical protein
VPLDAIMLSVIMLYVVAMNVIMVIEKIKLILLAECHFAK